VARSSPYNPISTINSVSYASIEAGNRESNFDSDFYHFIAGLNGEFAKNYFWEVGYVFDQNNLTRTDTGDQRSSLLKLAVVNGTFNPFVGLDAPRQGTLNGFTYDNAAALRAAGYQATSKTETQDQLLDGKIGGRAFTGRPQGGLNFVVGFELRRQDLSQNGDPILVAHDGLGFEAGTKFKAEQKVAAAYLELNIPFVSSTMNVPLVHNFDFTFAYRYERFEMSGIDPADGITESKQTLQTDVPKFALRWALVKDLTLRASYSRSFRAPTLLEFFEPRTENSSVFGLLLDPLNPGGRAFVQPPGGTIIGGSADLQPERTDDYSAGFVFTPRRIPNLTVTADYYQLNSEGVVITGFSQGAIVRNAADGSFAARVIRDASGALQQVLDFPFNSARKSVEGIDLTAVYEFPTDNFGRFTIMAAYNHLLRFNLQLIETEGFSNALGRFYSDSPFIPGSLPYNKGYLQTQWDYKGFQLINTFNYIGDYKDFGAFLNNSNLVLPTVDPANIQFTRTRDVKAYLTFDTQASYTYTAPRAEAGQGDAKETGKATALMPSPRPWQQWLDQTTIRIGMNNIFDEPPPFNAGAGERNDNYDTSLYSIRGRYYYIGLNKKF
jgi:iron complex outermembrane receptor protein